MKRTCFYLRAMLAVCLLAVGFAACSDDDEAPRAISFTQSDLLFLPDASSADIKFNAPAEWTAKTQEGWIRLSKTSGIEGDQVINVSVEQNAGMEDREGSIVVAGSSESDGAFNIKVKQLGRTAQFVVVEEKAIINPAQSAETTVQVLCNYDFTVNIPADAAWLTAEVTAQEGSSNRYDVTFKADLTNPAIAADFAEKTAQVTFTYKPATRALPADVTYTVVKEAFAPTIAFAQNDGDGDKEVATLYLTDEASSEGLYSAMVKVTSNAKWVVDQCPNWLNIEVVAAEEDGSNSSADYEEVGVWLIVSMKEGKADVGRNTGAITFKSVTDGKAFDASLNVIFSGLGENYIHIVQESLGTPSGMTARIMFPAKGTSSWQVEKYYPGSGMFENKQGTLKEFYVDAADLSDVSFILTKVDPLTMEPDMEFGTYQFVDVAQVGAASSRAINRGKFVLRVQNRSVEDEGSSWTPEGTEDIHAYSYRFFALFAVPTSSLPIDEWSEEVLLTPEAVFSHESIDGSEADVIKPQYRNNYIVLGQEALTPAAPNLEITGVESNVISNPEVDAASYDIPAAGGEITFSYYSEMSGEDAGWTFFSHITWNNPSDPYDYQGTPFYEWTAEEREFITPILESTPHTWYEGKYGVKLGANTTGKVREITFGLVAGASVFMQGDVSPLMHTFTVKQAAQ